MDDHGRSRPTQPTLYVLDTNVLIHDPNALLNFEEHHVAIPMTVLEELDKLKTGKHNVAAECRQAIRLIDSVLAESSPEDVERAYPTPRARARPRGGCPSSWGVAPGPWPAARRHQRQPHQQPARRIAYPASQERVVLVTKDINMRLKARAAASPPKTTRPTIVLDDVSLLSQVITICRGPSGTT